MNLLITGAGGFIGGHLADDLLSLHNVRTCDIKPKDEWHQIFDDAENWYETDLADPAICRDMTDGIDMVFHLAADMGGIGFITAFKAACMLSVLPSTNLLVASRDNHVSRFFFSSSACIYPDYRQFDTDVTALSEHMAYPAMCEDGYGWEKLFTERMCQAFSDDYDIETRVARFHNIYGPQGTYEGGREKSPAAICRKVIEAKLSGNLEIEIWGDGEQTRSFCYITDCVQGIKDIMNGPYSEPVNLGSAELVSINRLVDIVEGIADVKLERKYDLSKPQGVRGRNSDNTVFMDRYGWEPSVTLEAGLQRTYEWIYEEMTQ